MVKKSNNFKAGFSLIEIMVVLSILIIILGLGMMATFSSFKSTIFRSEKWTILSILERARSRSMNNYFGTSHGVCYDNSSPSRPSYVLFRGTYSAGNPTNEYLSGNPAVSIISLGGNFLCSTGPGISFAQLSGKTSSSTITILQEGRISVISVNQAGRINW